MKKIAFIILSFTLFSLGLSAQRKVRKETHKGDDNYFGQSYGVAEEKYKKAIELYTKSVEDDKKREIKDEDRNKEAFYNLGNTYFRQGKWDDALKEYETYGKMESNEEKQSRAWSNSGNAYLHKAIEPKPQQDQTQQGGQPQMQQQESLPRMEDLEKSIEAYKNALRRYPQDEEARYNLAVAQKMLQDQKDNQDKNKDNKDNKQDQKKDQDKKDQDKKDQDKKDQDKKDQEDKKDQDKQNKEQNENGMSQQNIEQMLNAMEQQEKETQARVQQMKAQEEKRKNVQNRKQDKDW